MAKLKRKGRHSPAGKKWLGGKSVKKKLKEESLKGTTPTYFRHIKRDTAESRLRKAGLTDKDLRALGYRK